MAYDVHLADRVRSILKRTGEFSERKMFGGIAFMANGQMCCGVLKADLVLRLTPEQATASLLRPHTRPMDFTGKPMKSMIYVSPRGTDSDHALASWVESAATLARSAPANKRSRRAGIALRSTGSRLAARERRISRPAPRKDERKAD